jgi:hypothetical protein
MLDHHHANTPVLEGKMVMAVANRSPCCAQNRSMPTEKIRCAHSPFAFQLHVAEGKSAFPGGTNQLLFTA